MKTTLKVSVLLFASAGAVFLTVPNVSAANENAPQVNVQINEPAGAQNIYLSSSGRFARASDLTGFEVVNQQNERLGQIKDVVYDWQSGRVPFAIISTESGDKMIAVPSNLLTARAGEKQLVLNFDKEKFMSAPAFTASTDLSSPAWANQLYTYYGQPSYYGAALGTPGVGVHAEVREPSGATVLAPHWISGRELDQEADRILHLYQRGKGAAEYLDRQLNEKRTGDELYAAVPFSSYGPFSTYTGLGMTTPGAGVSATAEVGAPSAGLSAGAQVGGIGAGTQVGVGPETGISAGAQVGAAPAAGISTGVQTGGFSEAAGAQSSMTGSTFTRSSDLIGMQVKDSAGNNIGEIKDVMIDWQSGRITYAVLAPTGISGLENKYLAIPPVALKRSSSDNKILMLSIDKSRLSSAPSFDQNNWPDPSNQSFLGDVYHFYGQTPYWHGSATTPSTPSTPSSQPPAVHEPSGAQSGVIPENNLEQQKGAERLLAPRAQGEINEASGAQAGATILLQGSVNSEQEKKDLEQKAMSLPGVMHVDNQLHIKSGGSQLQQDQQQQQTSQQGAQLQQSQQVKEPSGAEAPQQTQPSTTTEQQQSTQPSTTESQQPSTTESQTSGTQGLSQKVRTAFQSDTSLSPLATNVRVTEENGKITLSGTVKSEAEKQQLGSKAEEIAGAGNVQNNLEVKAPE